ncbi:DUF2490 domain-containing protein [Candidatus Neptunochlamydia vexilliferae]|uniref:DUF2490 domain-containing protein n=1 Tax=Candidatus Neptunichlamydia vexilliferae TaxID=1651774 RepID=A0ABS0B043_9BACT|nr:DUF2490 domain-containing protein [Candidatus Neptunochlamydia vexilliferae]MBF5059758.1 hypothetical protein [Candidatus Neptunochlamydia vexilliferae]
MSRIIRVLTLLLPLSLFGGLLSKGDFQVWNTDAVNIRVSRKMTLTGETQFRYGDGGKNIFYKHYQGGLLFFRSPHINFQTAYRQVYRRIDNKWEKEYNPFIDLTFQASSRRGWFISDRNRVVYRVRGGKLFDKQNLWLYRNRLFILPGLRLGKASMAPFFAYEFFWQESRGIDQNRLQWGLSIPYRKKTMLNLSYMLRYLKNRKKKWINQNVLWIDFSLHF